MEDISKIVELKIEEEDFELENLGLEVVSFVKTPAIEVGWKSFSAEEDKEMIDGIVDLLRQVENEENRLNMLENVFKDFDDEGIEYNREDILDRVMIDEFVERQADETKDEFIETGKIKKKELSKYEELEEIVVGDIVLTIEAQENILQLADERGEIIEPEDLYISTAKEQFSLLSDILKGLSVIDALTTNQAADSQGERFYRYSGPPAERAFCRAILRMNKVYSKKDIDDMEAAGINRAFGHEGQPYSIFQFHGGNYCKHRWNKLLVFRGTNNQKVIIDEGPADGNAGITMNSRPFGGHHQDYVRQHMMSMDEEKRIVLGPLLIPNKMIERKDDDGSKYYVYFSRETIKKIAEKMMREHKHNNTDINHDENINNKNVLLESWIVEDPTYDKSYNYGFKLPKGTWMASYKVGDDETWNMIKEGKLRGFSIAGYFIEGQKKREASISK